MNVFKLGYSIRLIIGSLSTQKVILLVSLLIFIQNYNDYLVHPVAVMYVRLSLNIISDVFLRFSNEYWPMNLYFFIRECRTFELLTCIFEDAMRYLRKSLKFISKIFFRFFSEYLQINLYLLFDSSGHSDKRRISVFFLSVSLSESDLDKISYRKLALKIFK